MFHLRWTPPALDEYRRLEAQARRSLASRKASGRGKSSRQEGLFQQVAKTLELLAGNPRHPGLQTHEYDSLENPHNSQEKVFEAYAQHRTPGAYRIFWCYGPARGEITILSITPHP